MSIEPMILTADVNTDRRVTSANSCTKYQYIKESTDEK